MIEEVTDNNLNLYNGYTLVDFYADWCGPCRVTANNLAKFIDEHSDIKVLKVNVEENEQLAEQYQIQSLPCIICFKDGEEYWKHVGLMTVKLLEEKFS